MEALSDAAVSPRIRDNRARRRGDILRAALRAFRSKGYHSTTLDDIAGDLGIGKTALYHYFPDKESILYECHRSSLGEVSSILAEAQLGDASPSSALRHVIREHVRVMTDTLLGSPMGFEVSVLTSDHQREIIAGRDAYERGLRHIIEDGIGRGEFRATNPKTATFAILGAINWIARWYRPEGEVRSAELGTQFADHLVGGLICQQ